MDNRIRLRVMGLSYNPQRSSVFGLLLAQVDGPYRIPIVIGAAEAQSIAVSIEGIGTPRPLTHDLFCSFAGAYNIELKEVFIYGYDDGIFSSEMRFSDGVRDVAIDARTSDAIAIAIRTHAPIYTTPEILSQTGTIIETRSLSPEEGADFLSQLTEMAGEASDNATNESESTESTEQPAYEEMTDEQLEASLADLIAEDMYEEAQRVNEILKRRRGELPEQQ